MSALLSFLGGSVFRMLWGEISAFVQKRQDHNHELAMMRLQRENDDAAHRRNMEAMTIQAQLKVEEVRVQGEMQRDVTELQGWVEAQKGVMRKTGLWLIDAWNGSIRPQFAQIALLLWIAKVVGQGLVMDPWDQELAAGILGFFVADRSLGKRGK